MPSTQPTVVYGVDPLCGWCFAIGDALRAARAQLGGDVLWEVALGGLVVGDRVRPVGEDADYLRAGLAAVEQVAGRRAGAAYWSRVVEPGSWVSDSEPAVRAVVAARELFDRPRSGGSGQPASDEVAVTVAHLLCDGLYLDGRVPDDPAQVEAVGSPPAWTAPRWWTAGAPRPGGRRCRWSTPEPGRWASRPTRRCSSAQQADRR